MASKQYPEGLVGKKIGMSQVFNKEGECIPVTVVETGPCVVLDLKSDNNGGYTAVQFGFGKRKSQNTNKAQTGHFAKAGKGMFTHVEEIRCDINTLGWTLGTEVKAADLFTEGQYVDVTGTSIGCGFSGVVRRFKVKGQPASRGTHEVERHIGAIGCRKTPGRVMKNKKMPGRYGGDQVTVQNLEIIAVRPADNVLLIKGAVPGSKGGMVVVRRAVKTFTGTVAPEAAPKAAPVTPTDSTEQAAA